MNKILNINLGGHPISIDEDAYQYLDRYIDTLEKHFKNSEGRDEIIEDIETRLAELMIQNLKGGKIVSLDNVKATIEAMGTPEEFDADFESGEEEPRKKSRRKSRDDDYYIRPGKRLFRDPENKVIAGVCSGLSSYLGIKDPIWMRLLFVLIFLTMGFGVLVYIIMWAAIPKAKSAADRLEMEGEPINIDSIARKVEEELEELGEKFNEVSEDIKNWGNKNKISQITRTMEQVLNFIIKLLSDLADSAVLF